MFADVKTLTKLRDDVEARYAWEVSKQSGLMLDEDDPPPPLDVDAIRKRLGAGTADSDRFPEAATSRPTARRWWWPSAAA